MEKILIERNKGDLFEAIPGTSELNFKRLLKGRIDVYIDDQLS